MGPLGFQLLRPDLQILFGEIRPEKGPVYNLILTCLHVNMFYFCRYLAIKPKSWTKSSLDHACGTIGEVNHHQRQ